MDKELKEIGRLCKTLGDLCSAWGNPGDTAEVVIAHDGGFILQVRRLYDGLASETQAITQSSDHYMIIYALRALCDAYMAGHGFYQLSETVAWMTRHR